jgi:DNA-binding PadR family transcriptional regulator
MTRYETRATASSASAPASGQRRRAVSPERLNGLVLTALVGPPAHGYAVTARLRAQAGSGGAVRGRGGRTGPELAEGTVYPVLHRLERSGLVRSRWADVAGRRRRVYELTVAGATAVERATVPAARWRLHFSPIGVA